MKKSKMADPRWSPFENMTLFGFHMTSSAGVVDLKGNLFKFRFHINLIFSDIRKKGRNPTVLENQKMPGLEIRKLHSVHVFKRNFKHYKRNSSSRKLHEYHGLYFSFLTALSKVCIHALFSKMVSQD